MEKWNIGVMENSTYAEASVDEGRNGMLEKWNIGRIRTLNHWNFQQGLR